MEDLTRAHALRRPATPLPPLHASDALKFQLDFGFVPSYSMLSLQGWRSEESKGEGDVQRAGAEEVQQHGGGR